MEVANELFTGDSLSRYFTASFTMLNPKVEKPTNFKKILPINLYIVAYNIFSKIIASRLFGYLDSIIFPE